MSGMKQLDNININLDNITFSRYSMMFWVLQILNRGCLELCTADFLPSELGPIEHKIVHIHVGAGEITDPRWERPSAGRKQRCVGHSFLFRRPMRQVQSGSGVGGACQEGGCFQVLCCFKSAEVWFLLIVYRFSGLGNNATRLAPAPCNIIKGWL